MQRTAMTSMCPTCQHFICRGCMCGHACRLARKNRANAGNGTSYLGQSTSDHASHGKVNGPQTHHQISGCRGVCDLQASIRLCWGRLDALVSLPPQLLCQCNMPIWELLEWNSWSKNEIKACKLQRSAACTKRSGSTGLRFHQCTGQGTPELLRFNGSSVIRPDPVATLQDVVHA